MTTDPLWPASRRRASSPAAWPAEARTSALLTTSSSGTPLALDFGEHGMDGVDLALEVRSATVHHVHQEVGLAHHFECRTEGLDQLMGKLPNEPHGVGDQHLLAAGRSQVAGTWVEGSFFENSRSSTSTSDPHNPPSRRVDFPALG